MVFSEGDDDERRVMMYCSAVMTNFMDLGPFVSMQICPKLLLYILAATPSGS